MVALFNGRAALQNNSNFCEACAWDKPQRIEKEYKTCIVDSRRMGERQLSVCVFESAKFAVYRRQSWNFENKLRQHSTLYNVIYVHRNPHVLSQNLKKKSAVQ